jgi:signal-transduction protein with cAMP-binding, CBS, and nucleotidyltransferase domain
VGRAPRGNDVARADEEGAMRVNEVMTTDVKTCTVSAMTADAAKRMREEGIGDVLVIEDDGGLKGILTDRDIVVRVVAEGRDPASVPVGDVCSSDLGRDSRPVGRLRHSLRSG